MTRRGAPFGLLLACWPMAALAQPSSPPEESTEPGEKELPDAITGAAIPRRAGTFAGDLKLMVPPEISVPPADPIRLGQPAQWFARPERVLDGATPLALQWARDGGIVAQTTFGGRATSWQLRGSRSPGAVTLALDGLDTGVLLSSRGSLRPDPDTLPQLGVDSYRFERGPFAGLYAGRVDVRSRRLEGIDAVLQVGERLNRGFAAAAGGSYQRTAGTMAIEGWQRSGARAGTADERLLVLGRGDVQLGEDTLLTALVRHHRLRWDDVGVRRPGGGFRFAPGDGGRSQGLEGRLAWHWRPARRTHVSARMALLEERFAERRSLVGTRERLGARNLVARGNVGATFRPTTSVPVEVYVGFGAAYDRGEEDLDLLIDGRRQGSLNRRRGEVVDSQVQAGARTEVTEGLVLGADIGLENTNLSRSTGETADARRTLAATTPTAGLWIDYRLWQEVGLRWRIGRGSRLAPNLYVDDPLHRVADATELTAYGTFLALGRWTLDARLTGFGTIYDSGFLLSADTNRLEVAGAELGVDFRDEAVGLSLRAIGGPLFARAPDDPSADDDVPSYVGHAGLIRAGEGVLFEAWLDVYGPTPRVSHIRYVFSPRMGYGVDPVRFWVGASGLLQDAPSLRGTESRPATERWFYLMLSVAS